MPFGVWAVALLVHYYVGAHDDLHDFFRQLEANAIHEAIVAEILDCLDLFTLVNR
jgi:hypothetical protein